APQPGRDAGRQGWVQQALIGVDDGARLVDLAEPEEFVTEGGLRFGLRNGNGHGAGSGTAEWICAAARGMNRRGRSARSVGEASTRLNGQPPAMQEASRLIAAPVGALAREGGAAAGMKLPDAAPCEDRYGRPAGLVPNQAGMPARRVTGRGLAQA